MTSAFSRPESRASSTKVWSTRYSPVMLTVTAQRTRGLTLRTASRALERRERMLLVAGCRVGSLRRDPVVDLARRVVRGGSAMRGANAPDLEEDRQRGQLPAGAPPRPSLRRKSHASRHASSPPY